MDGKALRGLVSVLGLTLGLYAPLDSLAEDPSHEGNETAASTESLNGGHAATAQQAGSHEGHDTEPAKQENVYSLFMHHAAGVGLVLVSLFLLAYRLTEQRFAILRICIDATWFLLGVFLFIRSDPEGWPIGPAGFLESFTMPTRAEWIQHKALSMIPMFMGIYTGRAHAQMPKVYWNYAAASLALFGALALTIHQHLDHPGMDVVNLQHRLFATTALFIAGSLVVDGKRDLTWKFKPYLLPCGLLILGLQLAFYVE
jgi:hypothetical protein